MRISDWSSDVCSSDLFGGEEGAARGGGGRRDRRSGGPRARPAPGPRPLHRRPAPRAGDRRPARAALRRPVGAGEPARGGGSEGGAGGADGEARRDQLAGRGRSEEHTSELPVTNAHLVCRLLLANKQTVN